MVINVDSAVLSHCGGDWHGTVQDCLPKDMKSLLKETVLSVTENASAKKLCVCVHIYEIPK